MAKLKVFAANLGFFETVVAAPSKKAALAAWGTHQDLFAGGSAAIATDPQAVEAALASPGVVLRRAVGSKGGFEAKAAVSDIALPPPPKGEKDKKSKAPPAPGKPPPDRGPLTAAEQALARREQDYAQARARLEARRLALEQEADALKAAYKADREALQAARDAAAKAYRKAGG